MINNLDTPSSKLQINCGVLQIDTENSATGLLSLENSEIFTNAHGDENEKVKLRTHKKRAYPITGLEPLD